MSFYCILLMVLRQRWCCTCVGEAGLGVSACMIEVGLGMQRDTHAPGLKAMQHINHSP